MSLRCCEPTNIEPYDQLSYRGQLLRLRRLAERAVALHGIENFTLQALVHGENTTFRVRSEDGREFLCRIHRPGYQTASSIGSELAWLKALRKGGLIVPSPLSDQPLKVEARGLSPRFVVLFDWLKGRFPKKPSVAEFRRLGAFMARLHEHASRFDTSALDRSVLDLEGLAGGVMGGALDDLPTTHRPIFERTVERARDVFDELGMGPDVWGLIHADLHPGNRLTVNGTPAAIDFDDCGMGYFLYDFAVALDHQRRNQPNACSRFHEALFLEYRRHRPLCEAHVQLLPAFFAIRAVALSLWVLHRGNDHPRFREFAPEYVAKNARGLSLLHNDPAW